MAYGSTPVEGSSRKIMGGFPIIAIDTDNFLLFPPDKLFALIFSYSTKSISLIYFFIICSFRSDFMPLIVEYISKCSLTVRPSNIVSN